jgi:hypothetical protein
MSLCSFPTDTRALHGWPEFLATASSQVYRVTVALLASMQLPSRFFGARQCSTGE